MVVTMYPPFPGSRLPSEQDEQESLESIPKLSAIHCRARKIRDGGSWREQRVLLCDYFGSGETVGSFSRVRSP
jgi:hypothetical protein